MFLLQLASLAAAISSAVASDSTGVGCPSRHGGNEVWGALADEGQRHCSLAVVKVLRMQVASISGDLFLLHHLAPRSAS
jgi:hypothetical protein